MKEEIIRQIEQEMLPYLSNEQMRRLIATLEHTLYDKDVIPQTTPVKDEPKLLDGFLNAKRVEGRSEKTLRYYQDTIQAMLDGIGKEARQILTEDLRQYLNNYQMNVTVHRLSDLQCAMNCPATLATSSGRCGGHLPPNGEGKEQRNLPTLLEGKEQRKRLTHIGRQGATKISGISTFSMSCE